MDTTDLQSLREDLNNLKDTAAEFVSQAGTDAVKTARDVTSNVASQVGNAASNVAEKGSEIATTASKQAKTFASELETLGRSRGGFCAAGTHHRACGALRAAGARLWGISGARHRRRGSGRYRVGLGQCCDDCSAREKKFAAPLTKPASASEMGRTSDAVFPEQGHYANDPEVLASYPPAENQLDQVSDLLNYEQSALLKRLRREAPAFVCVPQDRCLVSDSIAIPALVRMFLALG